MKKDDLIRFGFNADLGIVKSVQRALTPRLFDDGRAIIRTDKICRNWCGSTVWVDESNEVVKTAKKFWQGIITIVGGSV